MTAKTYLAIDLGASGGRVLAGRLDGGTITLDEVRRFPNGGIRVGDRLHWNVLGLWDQILAGLRECRERYGDSIVSVGVDTWGVDFALLDRDGRLLANPLHYRDGATQGVMESVFETVPREEIFRETGVQFMPINTLYQLVAMVRQDSPLLGAARSFLMMPDLFHYWLTGERVNERTNASTTQCYNPRTGTWSRELFDRLGLPSDLFGEIAQPGAQLGSISAIVAEQTGLSTDVKVVLPGTHDTASAVLAVPAADPPTTSPRWAYISSGTWSLTGVEIPEPQIDTQTLQENYTNEAGVGGTTRLLKNIAGLWVLQECRRKWAEHDSEVWYETLVREARAAEPLARVIQIDDPRFTAPSDMPGELAAYFQETGQALAADRGATTRAVLESLALRYRGTIATLERLTGGAIETVHLIGGGVQNELLCQMTADATGRTVVAGPVEATALGNVLMQAVADREFANPFEARAAVRKSFDPQTFEPAGDDERWAEAAARMDALSTGRSSA